MARQVIRLYKKLSDSLMLQEAQTVHDLFEDDQAEFEAYDADFAAPFAANFQSAIDAAMSVQTDEQVQDQIGALTEVVEAEMEKSRENFQDAKRFIKKAFPGQAGTWREFGFDHYEKDARLQHRLARFMGHFAYMVEKPENSTALAAINFTAAMQAGVRTRATALLEAGRAQEKLIKARPRLTHERLQLYNDVWRILQDLAEAAKSIYRDDYAKYNEYLLPGRSNHRQEGYAVAGTATIDGAPTKGIRIEIVELGLVTLTNAAGGFAFAQLPAGSFTLRASHPGLPTLDKPFAVVAGQATSVNMDLAPG